MTSAAPTTLERQLDEARQPDGLFVQVRAAVRAVRGALRVLHGGATGSSGGGAGGRGLTGHKRSRSASHSSGDSSAYFSDQGSDGDPADGGSGGSGQGAGASGRHQGQAARGAQDEDGAAAAEEEAEDWLDVPPDAPEPTASELAAFAHEQGLAISSAAEIEFDLPVPGGHDAAASPADAAAAAAAKESLTDAAMRLHYGLLQPLEALHAQLASLSGAATASSASASSSAASAALLVVRHMPLCDDLLKEARTVLVQATAAGAQLASADHAGVWAASYNTHATGLSGDGAGSVRGGASGGSGGGGGGGGGVSGGRSGAAQQPRKRAKKEEPPLAPAARLRAAMSKLKGRRK